MTLIQALTWAKNNCTPETVARLRSRRVVRTLVNELYWREQELNAYYTLVPAAVRVKVNALIETRRQEGNRNED